MLFERCSYYNEIRGGNLAEIEIGDHEREFIAAEKMENLQA
jgi:hypothetical protein